MQQGAEPAGLGPGAGALCRCACLWWVPVVTLLPRGCCNNCQRSGSGSRARGRISAWALAGTGGQGAAAEKQRRGQERRRWKERPRPPSLPSAPTQARSLVREFQGSCSSPKQLSSRVAQMPEPGGREGDTRPFVSQAGPLDSSWSFLRSRQSSK